MIRRLQKFLALDPPDQRILIYALCLVLFARVILWVVPFAEVNRRLSVPVRSRAIRSRREIEYFMTAITRAAKYVPGATCLTQSLAARLLLARSGFDATLRFGARRNSSGTFEAHAWIESDGKILGAPAAVSGFSPLPPRG